MYGLRRHVGHSISLHRRCVSSLPQNVMDTEFKKLPPPLQTFKKFEEFTQDLSTCDPRVQQAMWDQYSTQFCRFINKLSSTELSRLLYLYAKHKRSEMNLFVLIIEELLLKYISPRKISYHEVALTLSACASLGLRNTYLFSHSESLLTSNLNSLSPSEFLSIFCAYWKLGLGSPKFLNELNSFCLVFLSGFSTHQKIILVCSLLPSLSLLSFLYLFCRAPGRRGHIDPFHTFPFLSQLSSLSPFYGTCVETAMKAEKILLAVFLTDFLPLTNSSFVFDEKKHQNLPLEFCLWIRLAHQNQNHQKRPKTSIFDPFQGIENSKLLLNDLSPFIFSLSPLSPLSPLPPLPASPDISSFLHSEHPSPSPPSSSWIPPMTHRGLLSYAMEVAERNFKENALVVDVLQGISEEETLKKQRRIAELSSQKMLSKPIVAIRRRRSTYNLS